MFLKLTQTIKNLSLPILSCVVRDCCHIGLKYKINIKGFLCYFITSSRFAMGSAILYRIYREFCYIYAKYLKITPRSLT